MPAMLPAKLPRVDRFLGLNNVSDAMRLEFGWLDIADNVNVTDTGSLEAREGFILAMAGSITGAYSTIDLKRMYVVDGGVLKAMTGNTSALTLKTGLSPAPMHFTEINGQVFYNNGVDRGVILADNTLMDWDWPVPPSPNLAAVSGSLPAGLYRVCVTHSLPDGRETGASEPVNIEIGEGQALQISQISQSSQANVYIAPANSTIFQFAESPAGTAMVWDYSPDELGLDLITDNMDPLPSGADVIQEWGGRIYAAQYFPADNQTVIWFSQPLGFHLFNLNTDFFMVPGSGLMLAPTEEALIVGTDRGVFAFDGSNLKELADYGVVPGFHWSKDDKRTLFWTKRGLCQALPFSNLTENAVSVAPGIYAGGAIVRRDGQKRYVVALKQGDQAFNAHS